MKYLVFGETIWDVYPEQRVIGGAPFNFAAHASLLGGNVSLLTGVGRDELGQEALEKMRTCGIRTDDVCVNDRPTGQCRVHLDENGVPQYHVLEDTAYDAITLTEQQMAHLAQEKPDVFYFNTLVQRSPVSAETLRTLLDVLPARYIFCDINVRPGCYSTESLRLCMTRADLVKISEEEAHFLADCGLLPGRGDFAAEVHAAFPQIRLLLYTKGKDGSAVWDFQTGEIVDSGKPEQVEVVSTVGAGDCYSASFLDRWLHTNRVEEAVHFATERSNIVVAHTEAVPPVLASL